MDRDVVFLAADGSPGGDCRRQGHRQRSVRAVRMALPASQVITIAWSLFFVRFLMCLFGIVLGYRGRTGTGRGQDGRDGAGRVELALADLLQSSNPRPWSVGMVRGIPL